MPGTIACDESGSEGVNLIGANTAVFAHAGVRVGLDAAAACVGELRDRIGSPAMEYKANHLLRAKNRAALVWFLGPSGPLVGRAGVVLVDKALFVTGKVVDLLVDRVPYPDCLARRPDSRALALYLGSLRLYGPRWVEFLQSFTALLRTSQRRGPGLTPAEFFAQRDVLGWLAQVPLHGGPRPSGVSSAPRRDDPLPNAVSSAPQPAAHSPARQRGSISIEPPLVAPWQQRQSNDPEHPQIRPAQQPESPHLPINPQQRPEPNHPDHPQIRPPQQPESLRPPIDPRQRHEPNHPEHTEVPPPQQREPSRPQINPEQRPEPNHPGHPQVRPLQQTESLDPPIDRPPAREHLTELRDQLLADPSLVPPLDPLMPALVDTVAHWHPATVIHDEQPSLTPARLATLLGPTRDIHFVDSRADPRVQLADFLAGVTRRLAENALHHRGDPELTALLRPYLLPASIWATEL
ncbi:hypothetical protein [Amycolatopsis sp. NPDC001319]|uniref:hypothetical protein n=1 Tax=unclassified Amycolatopsis TaxID=2618356 RepID=UPI003674FF57